VVSARLAVPPSAGRAWLDTATLRRLGIGDKRELGVLVAPAGQLLHRHKPQLAAADQADLRLDVNLEDVRDMPSASAASERLSATRAIERFIGRPPCDRSSVRTAHSPRAAARTCTGPRAPTRGSAPRPPRPCRPTRLRWHSAWAPARTQTGRRQRAPASRPLPRLNAFRANAGMVVFMSPIRGRGRGVLPPASTAQPRNSSGSGRIAMSCGRGSPGTSRCGRPRRSSRLTR
jgi:hypothetical protein